jgi:hypothetical protein
MSDLSKKELVPVEAGHSVLQKMALEDRVFVTAALNPFDLSRTKIVIDRGKTILEILEQVGIRPNALRNAHVFIGEWAIPRNLWHVVRPKAGQLVTIRVIPKGGGGGKKNPLAMVLMIAVMVVATVVSFGAMSGALGVTMQELAVSIANAGLSMGMTPSVAFAFGGAALGAGISIVGNLLISALIPPPKQNMDQQSGVSGSQQDSPTLFIEGSRNQIRPYAPVPVVLGKFRNTPPFGARPYSEVRGDSQYVRMLYVWGYGPLTVEDERIGSTSLSEFTDYEKEFRRGYQPNQITPKGDWDASTGLYPATAVFGDRYVVSVAGEAGGILYAVDDTIIFNGLADPSLSAAWDKNHDKPFTIVVDDVYEDGFSIILKYSDLNVDADVNQTLNVGDPERTAEVGPCDNVAVQITFPNGMGSMGGEWRTVSYSSGDQNWEGQEWVNIPNNEQARFSIQIKNPSTGTFTNATIIKAEGSGASFAGHQLIVNTYSASALTVTTTIQGPVAEGTLAQVKVLRDVAYPGSEATWTKASKVNHSWVTRTSRPLADELNVDVTFPKGLAHFDGEGRKGSYSVTFRVEYAPTGTQNWTLVEERTVTGRQTNALRTNVSWRPATQGTYDVRIRRVSADVGADDTQTLGESAWTALRTITDRDPIVMQGVCATAMLIKATDQLNGVVDDYSAITQSILPTWDPDTETWVYKPTSSPASCFRFVAQGAANARALDDTRVGLESLQDWHEFCALHEFEYNAIHDYVSSVGEVLTGIAAVGRASVSLAGGKWSVLIDRPQTVVTQHFSPRNSWGFEGVRTYTDLPHGFRVRFNNRFADWASDERIVYADGYNEDNATRFEELQLSGITHPDHVWKDGRFHYAQAELRPDTYSFWTDAQSLACTRGDLIAVSHDVISVGTAWARIKDVILNQTETSCIGVVLDSEVEMELGKQYGFATVSTSGVKRVYTVQTSGGTHTTLSLAPAVATANAPGLDALASFGVVGQEVLDVIVTKMEPGEDLTAKITCVDAAPGIYTCDQGPIPPYETSISQDVEVSAPSITGIRSDEDTLQLNADGTMSIRILLDFAYGMRRADQVIGLQVAHKVSETDGSWIYTQGSRDALQMSLYDVEELETYDVRARFITTTGYSSWGPTITHTVLGASLLPPNIGSLFLEGNILRWTYPTKPKDFGWFEVRTLPGVAQRDAYDQAIILDDGRTTQSSFDISAVSRGARTFFVAAYDRFLNRSEEVAILYRDLGDIAVANVIVEYDYASLGFPGTYVGGTPATNGTTWVLPAFSQGTPFWTVNSAAFWTTNSSPFWTELYETLTYTASYAPRADELDAEVTLGLDIQGSWSIRYRTDSEDPFWTDDFDMFWSSDTLQMWEPMGDFKVWPGSLTNLQMTRYEFEVTVAGGTVQGVIRQFDVIADVPDESEYIEDFVLDPAGSRLPITKSYRWISVINPVLQYSEGGTAVTLLQHDKDPVLGPLYQAVDASRNGVAATIDALIQGARGL